MTDDGVRITRNDDANRYEMFLGSELAGFAEYRLRPDSRIVFIHTVVDPTFKGRGLGSRLAQFVLDDAVARGERIVPRCPFIAAYLRSHPEYEASVEWPVDAAPHA